MSGVPAALHSDDEREEGQLTPGAAGFGQRPGTKMPHGREEAQLRVLTAPVGPEMPSSLVCISSVAFIC